MHTIRPVSLAIISIFMFFLQIHGQTKTWTGGTGIIIPSVNTDSLGAGTSTPQGRIHSKIAAGLSNFVLETNVASPVAGSNLGQIDWYNSNSGGNQRVRILGSGDGTWSGGHFPTRMSFFTNDFNTSLVERMRIDANGNVGIGTTSPTSLLHTFATGSKTASYTANLMFNNLTSSTASVVKYGLDIQDTGAWNGTGSTNVGLHVKASGGTSNYAAIFEGGAVGIGTTTPVQGLDVGTSYITGGQFSATYRVNLNLSSVNGFGGVDFIYPNAGRARFCETGIVGTNDVFWQLYPGTPSGYGYLETWQGAGTVVGTGNATPIIFRPNRTSRMRLDSVGNLGIGTQTPKNHLDVTGSIVLGNTYAGSTVAAANALLVEGSIGIGTTNPDTFKIKANGTIKAKQVIVDVNGWPDYVFDDTNRLTPLTELEESIRQQKHLPDVPSASEIQSKGLDLGQMQVKLLKKLEELTLYVIDQDKKLKALSKENSELKDRVLSLDK